MIWTGCFKSISNIQKKVDCLQKPSESWVFKHPEGHNLECLQLWYDGIHEDFPNTFGRTPQLAIWRVQLVGFDQEQYRAFSAKKVGQLRVKDDLFRAVTSKATTTLVRFRNLQHSDDQNQTPILLFFYRFPVFFRINECFIEISISYVSYGLTSYM